MIKSKIIGGCLIMARKRKITKVGPMTEGKRNIIAGLLAEYDIKTAEDIQEALKDLLGGTIQNMLEAEMDEHLGYEPYERSNNSNSRNGTKSKSIRGKHGEIEIEVPQDRESRFEPQVVRKRQKDISSIEEKIISMYARGLSTRQISDQIEDIYGFEVSDGMVSNITNKLLPEIEAWQQRPLSSVYPIIFIDAVHFSVRDNNVIQKLAAYIILGVNEEGRKEVLSIHIGQNESSKYWLSVLNELKNRGVKDILILCADGLTGIKESIGVAFPDTEYQRCIVHQARNTLKYVADKDKKEFAADLKTIYHAPTEQKGYENMVLVTEKWESHYPNAMKSWNTNWDVICPIFKFSEDVRKVIYTTNAIESLNSTYRRLNRQRSVFPSDTALLKALYLATFEATKKWSLPIRNWGKVYGELSIMYDGRLSQ
jgi:putative transposase